VRERWRDHLKFRVALAGVVAGSQCSVVGQFQILGGLTGAWNLIPPTRERERSHYIVPACPAARNGFLSMASDDTVTHVCVLQPSYSHLVGSPPNTGNISASRDTRLSALPLRTFRLGNDFA
jgi:hypothetical protein